MKKTLITILTVTSFFSYGQGTVQLNQATNDNLFGSSNAANLSMAAIGLVTSRLYRYQMTPDLYAALAAGGGFLAGELTTLDQLRNVDHNIDIASSVGTSTGQTDTQIKSLERLKESYVQAKEAFNRKKNFQSAAATAFLLAAGIAGYQALMTATSVTACTSAISAAGSACTPAAPASAALVSTITAYQGQAMIPGTSVSKAASSAAFRASFVTEQTAFVSSLTAAAAAYYAAVPVGAAAGAACTAAASSLAPCGVMLTAMATSESATPVASPAIMGLNTPYAPLFHMIFESAIPMAQASLSSLSSTLFGASGAVIGMELTSGAAMTLDTMLLSPGNRALAWTAMATLAQAAIAANDNIMATIDGNIAKIDALIAPLNAGPNGIQMNHLNTVNTVVHQSILGGDTPVKDIHLNESIPCLSGPEDKKCAPLGQKFNSLPSMSGLSESMKADFKMVGKLADGISGNKVISSGTLSEANKLGGKLNAILAANKDLMKKLSLTLKNNVEKGQTDFISQLNKGGKDILKKYNVTPDAFVAMAANQPFTKVEAANKAKVSNGAKAVKVEVKGPASKEISFQLPEVKDDSEAIMKDAMRVPASNLEDKYDLSKNGVHTDTSTSIFDVITSRYIKSGYPRLLEEEKSDEINASAKIKN